jgi:hypothetical protein
VPAEVERALRARAGDRCEVPYCEHRTFVQIAHIVPHTRHGSRELANLWLACTMHHTQHDAGRIRIVGHDEQGKPVFVDADGRALRLASQGGAAPGTGPPLGRGPPGEGPESGSRRPPDVVRDRGPSYVARRPGGS